MFVANRATQIYNVTNLKQWYHVCTEQNPAYVVSPHGQLRVDYSTFDYSKPYTYTLILFRTNGRWHLNDICRLDARTFGNQLNIINGIFLITKNGVSNAFKILIKCELN